MTATKRTRKSGKEKKGVKSQKTIHPDGSYAEIIADYRTNRVEIGEYDAQGKDIIRVYGRIEEIPKVSDDEINAYLDKLGSKYRLKM